MEEKIEKKQTISTSKKYIYIIIFYICYIGESSNFSISPKRSKLSNIIENDINEEIKEYDRIIKEEINSNKESNNEDKLNNLFKFTVYFYFKINEKNEYIFPIESDYFDTNTQHIYELIYNIIQKINSEKIIINFNNNDFIISLKESEEKNFYINNYELRPSKKKTHLPKYDYPCYDSFTLLNNIISQRICFVVKNPKNIILTEKIDKELENVNNNNKHICTSKCIIM